MLRRYLRHIHNEHRCARLRGYAPYTTHYGSIDGCLDLMSEVQSPNAATTVFFLWAMFNVGGVHCRGFRLDVPNAFVALMRSD